MSKNSSLNKMIVAKFGGTSMNGAANMLRCIEIVLNSPHTHMVVVSATAGTTNNLLLMLQDIQQGSWSDCQAKLTQLTHKHQQIIQEMMLTPNRQDKVSTDLQLLLKKLHDYLHGMFLLKEVSAKGKDYVLSFGERISSLLFATYLQEIAERKMMPLQSKLLDARKVMITDETFGEGRPQLAQIKMKMQEFVLPLLQSLGREEKLAARTVFVTQGFIGSTHDQFTTTLGRGGSDYSAAILAEALEASALEIWTDVAGIYTMDPRMIPEAKAVPEISYLEAAELANLGAKVLHPLTLIPAIRQKIPVYVGNSFDASQPGTWIKESTIEGKVKAPLIRALAYRPKQSILTLSKIKSPDTYGFLAQVFSILSKYRISIDLITTSEISTAMTIHNMQLLTEDVMGELHQIADVQLENSLGLISLIGEDLVSTTGVPGKIFQHLLDYKIRFMCMGSGKNNISFLVSDSEAKEILQKLHQHLI